MLSDTPAMQARVFSDALVMTREMQDSASRPPTNGTFGDARLQALYTLELLDSPEDPAFDRLTGLVRRLLKVPVALVSFVDVDRQFFKSAQGLPQPWASLRQTPLSHSFCQHVVASQEPLVISDARTHPLVCDNLAVRDLNVVAYLGIPLATPEGHVLGSLCAIDGEQRTWSPTDVEVLSELAALVMTEVDLQHQLRQRKHTEEKLAEHAKALKQSNEELEHFAAMAAHDLREPLHTISNFAQLLHGQYSAQLDEDASRYLSFIVNATGRMHALTDDLLAFSRLESREIPKARIDPNAVLAQVLAGMQHTLEATEATITADALPSLVADTNQLHLLFQKPQQRGPPGPPFRNDRQRSGPPRHPGQWHWHRRRPAYAGV